MGEGPSADDVKALLAHFRLAAYRSGKVRDLETPFPTVFGGYLRRAAITSLGHERLRLAQAVYRAAAASDDEGERRALIAVGWHYGLFGPPRNWTHVKLPAKAGWSRAAAAVSGDSARRGHARAFALLAGVLPAHPGDPRGETYPQTPVPLGELDLVAALGALDPRLDADLFDQLAARTLDSERVGARIATTVSVLGAVHTDGAEVPPLPPHDLDRLERLEGRERGLVAAAHRCEPLDSADVSMLVAIGDRLSRHAERPDRATAQVCYAGALVQTALRRTSARDRDVVWAGLERRALARSIDVLRSMEHPAAHRLGRRLAHVLHGDVDTLASCAINLSIVSSAHGRYRLGHRYLVDAVRAVRGALRSAGTDVAQWEQQIALAMSGVGLRELRRAPADAAGLCAQVLRCARAAERQADRLGMPSGWRIAARRRQMEIVTAAMGLGLMRREEITLGGRILESDRDAAASVDPWWDLQQRKASLQFELASDRFRDAAATLEHVSRHHHTRLSHHHRWNLAMWEARVELEHSAPSALGGVHLGFPALKDAEPYAPAHQRARSRKLREVVA